ncbi:MgtC/SapB family protein [Anaerobacillus isosaccharinicus]|uniref:Magnesium transporter MgtC n=1 Tax=Anaerobacillus isosaccharinicus TaxID=1532552 RepID=A0A1S2MHV2_9BACI|nr:MgtC/SapB family protein [Anaerobacillus isosaccharinicus]MBA5584092.1 MgtC/SapB family protein [Anaerobacillus isosaccharinicus]QOY37496.1 MgtC/SapB family protein [Anaerobacillus isosaccharinicus]
MELFEAFFNSDTATVMTRLVFAAILGGVVGVEREYNRHPAGFRTHLLVCVGACLVMLLAMFGFQDYMEKNAEFVNFDPSRLAAYVVSGIGFLGAGTIIVQGVSVRGLTTAASIWVVAGIGLSIGVGMYIAGIFTTGIVILSLIFLNKVEDSFFKRKKEMQGIVIHAKPGDSTLLSIITILEENHVRVKKIMVERDQSSEIRNLLRYQIKVIYPNQNVKLTLIEHLYKIEQVHKVYSL